MSFNKKCLSLYQIKTKQKIFFYPICVSNKHTFNWSNKRIKMRKFIHFAFMVVVYPLWITAIKLTDLIYWLNEGFSKWAAKEDYERE